MSKTEICDKSMSGCGERFKPHPGSGSPCCQKCEAAAYVQENVEIALRELVLKVPEPEISSISLSVFKQVRKALGYRKCRKR